MLLVKLAVKPAGNNGPTVTANYLFFNGNVGVGWFVMNATISHRHGSPLLEIRMYRVLEARSFGITPYFRLLELEMNDLISVFIVTVCRPSVKGYVLKA
jgi:hypothetical protein